MLRNRSLTIGRCTILLILCSISLTLRSEDKLSLRIMSYNVENLFDTAPDSLHADDEFLPDGAYHWTYSRYRTKLSHIAQVISAVGEWQAPALVGLLEVENDSCLHDLLRWHLPRRFYPYRSILMEGPDERGIDPALLYDSTRLRLLCKEAIPVRFSDSDQHTRDILHAEFCLTTEYAGIEDSQEGAADTLHVFLCHFPSQRVGATESEMRRSVARATLLSSVSAILERDSAALILAMGDFNSTPADNMHPLINLMLPWNGSDAGSHKFQGRWTCLDQFCVSSALLPRLSKPTIFSPDWLLEDDEKYLGKKPKRTYVGPRYMGGYSDHLPIVIDMEGKREP